MNNKSAEERAAELCYIGFHDCGGWQAVTVISSDRKREIAKDVASWIRAGLRVETWTVARFRSEARMCQCLKQKKTSNPKRYQEFNPWPNNCWLGATVTNQADADARIPELLKAQARVLFASVEPMLGPVDLVKAGALPPKDEPAFTGELCNSPYCGRPSKHYPREFNCRWGKEPLGLPGINWLIIGAMTGPGSKDRQPQPEWVRSLVDQARAANVPLFLKNNLHWPEKIQEWPSSE